MNEHKFTQYFENEILRKRPYLKKEWCIRVIKNPIKVEPQEKNRFRFWGKIEELEGKIEFLRIKNVPVISCYKDVTFSRTLVRILNEKKREVFHDEKGGIAIYPNTRPPGTIALSRYHDDKRIDFTRISHYEKVTFAHPQGFFASVEPLSEYELEQYIKDAIVGKDSSS